MEDITNGRDDIHGRGKQSDDSSFNLPAVPVLTSQWRFQVDASWSEESNGIGMGFVLFEHELEVLHKDNEKGHKQNHHYTQRQKAYVGR